jgi:hypothetical protein
MKLGRERGQRIVRVTFVRVALVPARRRVA